MKDFAAHSIVMFVVSKVQYFRLGETVIVNRCPYTSTPHDCAGQRDQSDQSDQKRSLTLFRP